MSAYYNEIDPYCCEWLRNLIAKGLIAPGDVDERSIIDVKPEDLKGYTQCHFFAGIGGWSHALRLSLWPDDRHVWTGSCPCQPFSAAGRGKASGDKRHLWPAWFELIRACRPPVIFGEQVEAAIGWGWLDLVHTDMEAEGYTVGAAVLPACSVGAPHIRQRLWFVADANPARCGGGRSRETGNGRDTPRLKPTGFRADLHETRYRNGTVEWERMGNSLRLADSIGAGLEIEREQSARDQCQAAERSGSTVWANTIWLPCTDGKQRPTQPGIFPLAHGVSGRVAKLRAAGNAIVPQVAAEFIKATMQGEGNA